MTTNLEIIAKEQGLIKITAAFSDEDGNAVTPTTLTWTLTDRDGVEIATGTVETPGASNVVVISGDDLALQSGETSRYVERRVLFEGTYTSDLGSGLPLKWDAAFLIEDIAGVS